MEQLSISAAAIQGDWLYKTHAGLINYGLDLVFADSCGEKLKSFAQSEQSVPTSVREHAGV